MWHLPYNDEHARKKRRDGGYNQREYIDHRGRENRRDYPHGRNSRGYSPKNDPSMSQGPARGDQRFNSRYSPYPNQHAAARHDRPYTGGQKQHWQADEKQTRGEADQHRHESIASHGHPDSYMNAAKELVEQWDSLTTHEKVAKMVFDFYRCSL